jgi:hypothetical protein
MAILVAEYLKERVPIQPGRNVLTGLFSGRLF